MPLLGSQDLEEVSVGYHCELLEAQETQILWVDGETSF